MSNATLARVVRVTSLSDFVKEVPPEPALSGKSPVARLVSSRVESETCAALRLSLQGVNAAGEIVWLCENHTVNWLYGQPFGDTAESFSRQMPILEQIVTAQLQALGYDVRTGDYGLPGEIKPLAAYFECARWVKDEGGCTWRVVAEN